MSLIVIVEESLVMAQAAVATLIEAGFEAVYALNTSDALSICLERRADLVLTEYYLGEVTGLDLMETLRRQTPGLPVAVCTGCGREEAVAVALEKGVSAWLVKTDNYLQELPGIVKRLLDSLDSHRTKGEKYSQLSRQQAQGEMAEWLAHNFKNILAASIGYLNLIDFNNLSQNPTKRQEFLSQSRESQESAINLLEQLIRLTETQAGVAELVQVAEVADDSWDVSLSRILDNVKRQYPEDLASVESEIGKVVFLNFARRLAPVRLVPSEVASILEALLQNALEAVLKNEDPRVLLSGKKKGDHLEITVRDNGRGMDATTLKHALEPLFSTKGEVGVGLGLSLVNSLVMRHGGDVKLESVTGSGTTVKVSLPQ